MSGEIVQGAHHRGDLSLDADVVVIGSGAGGAVVAAELSAAGKRVVVVEEGPYHKPTEYGSWRPSEHMRRVWRDGGMGIAVGVGDTPMINVTMGRVVGGSSVLTGGVCFRVPEEINHIWSQERGLTDLTAAGMAPFYEAVEKVVHVETVPMEMRGIGTQRFGEGLQALHGADLVPLRRNTKDCVGSGRCNFGCPKQAKLSVDIAYLPTAIRDGATLLSDCLVERVVMKGNRAVGVRGRLVGGPRARRRGNVEVRAKRVVVACGGWHSPLLLKRSGLGGLRSIGRHLTLHPAFRMMARFDEPIRSWSGALQSAYSNRFMDEGMTMVGLAVPPGVLAATVPGFGARFAERARALPNIAVFGGMLHDEAGGTVHRGPGREPIVTYRMAKQDRARVPTLIRRMAEIFFEAGAKECFLPVLGLHAIKPDDLKKLDLERVHGRNLECSSQHPLGSCRMGTNPMHSSVDPSGRVWGTEGLYVADGSVVPSSLGVNPQLTVMAMALRIARRMASGREI